MFSPHHHHHHLRLCRHRRLPNLKVQEVNFIHLGKIGITFAGNLCSCSSIDPIMFIQKVLSGDNNSDGFGKKGVVPENFFG
jgi:hypothetical protein